MPSEREIKSIAEQLDAEFVKRLRTGAGGGQAGFANMKSMPLLSTKDIKAFQTAICGGDDCWHWLGSTYTNGYGRFNIRGKSFAAHRLSWFIETGIDPGDLCVCHSCDNRICCRPSHLFLGTYRDNNHDMIAKGRARWRKGPDHVQARFNKAEVQAIRLRHTRGESCATLAEVFGVHKSAIGHIVKGTRYASVN